MCFNSTVFQMIVNSYHCFSLEKQSLYKVTLVLSPGIKESDIISLAPMQIHLRVYTTKSRPNKNIRPNSVCETGPQNLYKSGIVFLLLCNSTTDPFICLLLLIPCIVEEHDRCCYSREQKKLWFWQRCFQTRVDFSLKEEQLHCKLQPSILFHKEMVDVSKLVFFLHCIPAQFQHIASYHPKMGHSHPIISARLTTSLSCEGT